MNRRLVFGMLIWLTVLLCRASGAGAAGAMVDNQNLQLTFPHIEYAGQRYHVVLDFAGDLGDGLYWKFKTIEPTTVTGQCGGVVDGNLNIQNVCALLSGNEYQVNLEFRENPFGQIGLFWKLASNIVQNPCVIRSVRGGGEECYDISYVTRLQACVTECGDDVECISGCGQLLLAVEYTNSTPVDQLCVLPSGVIFRANDERLQNSLLLKGKASLVPASGSKTICLATYCLNSDREGPEETDTYSTGGGAVSACMIEILTSVQGKAIEKGSAIQDIVWSCVDGGLITEAQRAYLRGLQVAN